MSYPRCNCQTRTWPRSAYNKTKAGWTYVRLERYARWAFKRISCIMLPQPEPSSDNRPSQSRDWHLHSDCAKKERKTTHSSPDSCNGCSAPLDLGGRAGWGCAGANSSRDHAIRRSVVVVRRLPAEGDRPGNRECLWGRSGRKRSCDERRKRWRRGRGERTSGRANYEVGWHADEMETMAVVAFPMS
jgi:hypothetical protein